MLGQHNRYLQNWGGCEMARWAKVLTTEPAGLRSTTGTYTVEGENQILQVVFWPSHVCRGTHDLAKPSAHTGECSLGENKLSKQKLFENGCCRWIHTSADANMAERSTPTNVPSCSIPCLSLEWRVPHRMIFFTDVRRDGPLLFACPPGGLNGTCWMYGEIVQLTGQATHCSVKRQNISLGL